ncbi:hypothetical protein CERSUDRAFT_109938 [Gelatoporia subvermispora B]|uniref:Survival Motor Neuron Gemin2-binding domain-containing protein n=1 Tax=Ceriporiopsis subvermispora (strain B) TaxID=914234 RepID=M2RR33_CERS8|nr:hypothetical protein CERSUDRAFT_109938 [Gelatoporia subvermispora B]
MRQVVSYDDLANTHEPAPAETGSRIPTSHSPPPAKKRKTSNPRGSNGRAQHVQHWDDPGSEPAQMSYDDQPAAGSSVTHLREEYTEEVVEVHAEDDLDEEGEESRELTHEEMWDDSALIDAWDSAMAEYKAYHGSGKDWKKEPVKKSPLWYNVPPSSSSKAKAKKKAATSKKVVAQGNDIHVQAEVDPEADSTPLDFSTFVPSHDPSLANTILPHSSTGPGYDHAHSYVSNQSEPIASQDEAFQRALTAMYWGGYWTAVYHCQRHAETASGSQQTLEAGAEGEEQENEQGEDAGDEEEDMLPAQR